MIPKIHFSQVLEPLVAKWPWFLGIIALLIVTRILASARLLARPSPTYPANSRMKALTHRIIM